MLAPGDKRVDPYHLLESQSGVRENRRDVVECQVRLFARRRRNLAVLGDAQLARAEDESLTRGDLDAVGIGRERRMDGRGRKRLVHIDAQLTGKTPRKPAQKRALLVLI